VSVAEDASFHESVFGTEKLNEILCRKKPSGFSDSHYLEISFFERSKLSSIKHTDFNIF